MSDASPLKILHVLRAPVGGLFRHVLDVAREQAARGHHVGIVADSLTGGQRAEQVLAQLDLALGLSRVAIPRNPGLADLSALAHVRRRIRETQPDIVHGHGSKGGVLARVGRRLAGSPAITAYTPHGGSFNYHPGSTAHRIYMTIEGWLRPLTSVYLFESDYIAGKMRDDVGPTKALQRVVWNGVSKEEFTPVTLRLDATDFFYIGELREVKGLDTLLDALASIHAKTALRPRLTLVGSGPDEAALRARSAALGLDDFVTFAGALPAREAFARGRVMVVPSRAESLPYVVLEAAAARKPLVSTNAGGIPEIFGPLATRLFDPGDADLLARRMIAAQETSDADHAEAAQALFDRARSEFTLDAMVDRIVEGYREAIANRDAAAAGARTGARAGSLQLPSKA